MCYGLRPLVLNIAVHLTTRPRDIIAANIVLQQTQDILEYFEPRYWFIENPQTGLMKNQIEMWGIPGYPLKI